MFILFQIWDIVEVYIKLMVKAENIYSEWIIC